MTRGLIFRAPDGSIIDQDEPPQRAAPLTPVHAFASGAVASIPFSDELIGVAGGLGSLAEGRGYRSGYVQTADAERARREALERAHGGAYTAGTIGGSLGLAFTGAGAAALGARAAIGAIPAAARAAQAYRAATPIGAALTRIGTAAGGGGIMQGLSSAGQADYADAGQRAMVGLRDAPTGAILGAAGQAVIGEVAVPVAQRFMGGLSSRQAGQAYVTDSLRRYQITPQRFEGELRRLAEHPDATVMDALGPAGPDLARGAGQRPTLARSQMRDFFDERNRGMAERAIGQMQSLTGERSASRTVEALRALQRQEGGPLIQQGLDEARLTDATIARLSELRDRNPRLFDEATRRTQQLAVSETGREYAVTDPRYWHALRQGADDRYRQLRSGLAGDGGLDAGEARRYGEVLGQFRREVADAMGSTYRQGNELWSGAARQEGAIELGYEAMAPRLNDLKLGEVRREMQRMTPGELDMMRMSALQRLADEMRNAPTEAGRTSALRSLMASPGRRVVLEELFGGKEGLEQLMAAFDLEQRLFQNTIDSGLGTGSQTAFNLGAMQAQEAATAGLGGLANRVLGAAAAPVQARFNEDVSDTILRLLGQRADEALREIDAAGGVQQWLRRPGVLQQALQNELAQERDRALRGALMGSLIVSGNPVLGAEGGS